MLNTSYRLVKPRQIEAEFCDIDICGDNILVRPTHLSICNADQRYFQGTRSAEALKKKLPMALIHEGIGRIIYDPRKEFSSGTYVVLIPNTPYEEDEIIGENYLRSSRFRASGWDGFMQDCISMRRDRILTLPADIDKNVAAFTELVSVANHTIDRFDERAHSRRNIIGIWGDGNLAYITALLYKKKYPNSKVIIFGKHDYKLREFVFVDETYHVDDIPSGVYIDHGFECVGGAGSAAAINQIIDLINPEGTIAAMGVSEDPAPINTRMVLEKGLSIFGSSRSGRTDFQNVIALYEKRPEIVEYLMRIVGQVIEVRSIDDMIRAFDTDMHKHSGKTVMLWEK